VGRIKFSRMDLDLFNRASAFFTEEKALAKIKGNQSDGRL